VRSPWGIPAAGVPASLGGVEAPLPEGARSCPPGLRSGQSRWRAPSPSQRGIERSEPVRCEVRAGPGWETPGTTAQLWSLRSCPRACLPQRVRDAGVTRSTVPSCNTDQGVQHSCERQGSETRARNEGDRREATPAGGAAPSADPEVFRRIRVGARALRPERSRTMPVQGEAKIVCSSAVVVGQRFDRGVP